MSRLTRWIVLALALGGVSLLLLPVLSGPHAPPASAPQRPAPAIPAPTLEEKIHYFHRVLQSGKTLTLGAPAAIEVPIWLRIGGEALLRLGEPALDFLTSPDRYPEYVVAPNLLVTVLDLLAEAPAWPGAFPFLVHWSDERNCPPAVSGSDWPDEIRVRIFAALRAHPVPEAAPLCLAEFERPRRAHDLRAIAVDILLIVGQADALNEIYRTLPPTPEAPSPDLRAGVLERLFRMAAPAAGDRNRRQVATLTPLLEEALKSPRPIERMNAMAILLRVARLAAERGLPAPPGRSAEDLEKELERFFEEYRAEEILAWSALKLLAADRAVPFVREACLARVQRPETAVGFPTAVALLAQWWPEEIVPHFAEWVGLGVIDAYMVLPALLRVDREGTVRWLRDELRASDTTRLLRAVRFVAGEQVAELVPDLLGLARNLDPAGRPPIYEALVAMRAPGVEALLLAELSGSIPDHLRDGAAVELLNLGGDEGHARLAELLAEGDGVALSVVLRRAMKLGEQGVPAVLAPAVLRALRTMPGEDGRRAALLALRFRGRFDDVRDGLIEAYRFEPSRKVAADIGEGITELAHR